MFLLVLCWRSRSAATLGGCTGCAPATLKASMTFRMRLSSSTHIETVLWLRCHVICFFKASALVVCLPLCLFFLTSTTPTAGTQPISTALSLSHCLLTHSQAAALGMCSPL
jgi:hypothetical protein